MTNRIILGKLPDLSYGLMISKPGVDVTTAVDGDLMFDSRATGFSRIATRGELSFTNGGANTRTAAVSGVGGRAPIFWCGIVNTWNGSQYMRDLWDDWTVSCTSSLLTVTRPSSWNAADFIVAYMLFTDAAS
jgi:hypothetical protein